MSLLDAAVSSINLDEAPDGDLHMRKIMVVLNEPFDHDQN